MNIKEDTNKNDNFHHLSQMGWNSHFQTQLEHVSNNGFTPARVVGVRKNSFRTSDGKSEWLATLKGRLKHDADGMYPVTGDWVLMNDAVISRVLVRKNELSRGASGTRNKQDAQPQKEQIIAANLDTVFIVSGLDQDFNLRRMERYLTLVYNCGLNPVIILTKADLHKDPGRTTAMVGSSGAGKSTLVNRLYGKTVQLAASLSTHAGKGKHTTTSRDLFMMPQGGMVIDNPGIREIAFRDVDKGIEVAFPEIEN